MAFGLLNSILNIDIHHSEIRFDMQDTIIEEILRAPSLRERTRARGRVEAIIPPANRYPHKMKRAELERNRQPWSSNVSNNVSNKASGSSLRYA